MFPYDLFLMTQSQKHISHETLKIITVYTKYIYIQNPLKPMKKVYKITK